MKARPELAVAGDAVEATFCAFAEVDRSRISLNRPGFSSGNFAEPHIFQISAPFIAYESLEIRKKRKENDK